MVHNQLPVLRLLKWSPQLRRQFFASGHSRLPRPEYPALDLSDARAQLTEARALCQGDDVVDAFLRRTADALETTVAMLQSVGTPEFSRHSQTLYGSPGEVFPGTHRTPLELARRVIKSTEAVAAALPPPPEPTLTAEQVAAQIQADIAVHFGDKAPAVEVVDVLGARASAAPKRIRLRRGAKFSDLDVRQLVQHEALVHVATALNGRRQRRMPILAANHAATTKTQEGLAVFAELVAGTLDPHRLLRIAHRVVAIDMALGGADFRDVYRYFLPHSIDRVEAYQSTARVFRGGVVTGGAPFVKDMVYLDGLCRVHVFVRAAIDTARVDCLRLLFAGKFALTDMPAIVELQRRQLCRDAQFVPPWVSDPRRLVAYFAATDIIGRAATAGLRKHYKAQLRALRRA